MVNKHAQNQSFDDPNYKRKFLYFNQHDYATVSHSLRFSSAMSSEPFKSVYCLAFKS